MKVMISLLMLVSSLHAQEEMSPAELEKIDPAARFEKMQKLMPASLSDGVKILAKEGEASVWDSTGKFQDPDVLGEDVSSWFELENVAEPVGIYRYSSFGKEDPFMAPVAPVVSEAQTSIEIPIVSPLQVSMGSLKVVGVWSLDDGTRRALVMGGNGQGVIAKIGDPIGLAGKIIDINHNGIMTRQFRLRSDGAREYSDVNLPFNSESTTQTDASRVVLNPGQAPIVTPMAAPGPTTNTPNPGATVAPTK